MELQGGIPLLMQQYKALLRKNFLLALRNKPATFLQLFSSFFFIFLLFCIRKSDEAQKAASSLVKDLRDPEPLVMPPIPPCEDRFYIKTPCYDFIWSGKHSRTVGDVVKRIMANNPGRPIPPNKVLAFNNAEDVDKWLYDNPVRCPAALHFRVMKGDKIHYGIQTNSTEVTKRGQSEDPTFKFQIPLQLAAEREIGRSLIGDPNYPWEVSFKEFPHPPDESLGTVAVTAMIFFMAVAIFGFVLQITALITEKELKLRQAMTMMGLYDTAYWLSWITWETLLIFCSSTLTVIFGMMFQFDFFLRNNVMIVFLLFFLFQLTMVSFGYWLSAFLSKAASATNIAFVIFIIGFITMLVTVLIKYPYNPMYAEDHRTLWSFFPPNLLTIGLMILMQATETSKDPGISWSNRAECLPSEPGCVITIHDVFILHVKTFFFWFILAIYFDNIIPNISGVRKSKFYFLYPGYWTGNGGSSVKEGGNCSLCSGSLPRVEPITPDDEDVLTEENTVKKQAMEGGNSNTAVQIRGLIKTYPGKTTSCCFCCCRKTTPPFHSVKGLWLNIKKDQLLCMLGPNGAGKTTTISCLTGINPVTQGDAFVYDQSIRSSMGMTNIRRMMGVCPQFDILWDSLSGRENLEIFANIKGLPPASVDTVVAQLLSQSKITKVSAKMRSCSYSGGMKRRLSVAIALIGDPKLVILDEPTTGMDPITRRHVWDIIESAKKGRAIILTTHSMEEADVLSDRIGIMAKGRLRCIGTSIRLKAKFGSGFIASVGLSSETTSQPEAVKQFFKSRLDVVPKDENKSVLTYVIPHDREKLLTEFFAELQARESEFGIKDVQLGLTTLEEVFMNIAKQADVETAIAEGRFSTLTLSSGNSIEVPAGTQFVGIPGTKSPQNPGGIMVEIYWEPDENGSLCISGHSEEMPIPPHIQLKDPPNTNSDKTQGIVIHPSQLKVQ